MTLNARRAFFSEKNNNNNDLGWSGAYGRMTLNARWTFFSEQTMILDEAEHVYGDS